MRRFGYLEQNPDDSEALYHETAIIEAIKNIQKYGALNQTGKLDVATLAVCSNAIGCLFLIWKKKTLDKKPKRSR